MEETNNSECPVCYQTKLLVSNKYECIHCFCQECYNNWHMQKNTCPLCRSLEVNCRGGQAQRRNGIWNTEITEIIRYVFHDEIPRNRPTRILNTENTEIIGYVFRDEIPPIRPTRILNTDNTEIIRYLFRDST